MTIEEFAQVVEQDLQDAMRIRFARIIDEAGSGCAVRVVPGRKYTKVDVKPGYSATWTGRFMVDQDGNIFGIKGYGVIHRGRRYGTLNTVNEWFWGNYYPVKK